MIEGGSSLPDEDDKVDDAPYTEEEITAMKTKKPVKKPTKKAVKKKK